jgi:hypothetical protein
MQRHRSRHVHSALIAAFAMAAGLDGAGRQAAAPDLAAAAKFFAEAKRLSDADGGKLWGKPLYGPMLLVDVASATVMANEADRGGRLKREGDVFIGAIPASADIPQANTATEWSGTRWSVILLPLPEDEVSRSTLLGHELFHRVQPDLGFPAADPFNQHIDEPEGRLWLQLEWRALSQSLTNTSKGKREKALEDALVFREQRRRRYPNAAASENALELHEGLAEYTGVLLSGQNHAETLARVAERLKQVDPAESYVRSFAYRSGPAYGLLLDAASPDWRKTLRPSHDLGRVLLRALGTKLPTDITSAADRRAGNYGGNGLRRAEQTRAKARAEKMGDARSRFIKGAILELPIGSEFNFTFDPGTLVSLGVLGTIYPTATISDEWGTLDVKNGVLIDFPRGRIILRAPASVTDRPVTGDGWTLELKADWQLEPGQRQGDYVLRPK